MIYKLSNLHIHKILMKTLEIREKMLENLKGCTYSITHMSVANYSRLPKLVPNER